MRLLERGWLSSNCVLFLGGDETVLVDSGYGSHAPQTVALVEYALAKVGVSGKLDRVVNTHLHSDHCGGNAALYTRYACRIDIPVGYAEAVRVWDEDALSFAATGQACQRFGFDATIAAGDTLTLGGMAWQALAAPGHDDDSLIFYCASEGILISADALWEDGSGAIFPEIDRPLGFAAAQATLALIASLDIRLVIPGHGAPFTDVSSALRRATGRLAHLASDPRRNARHVVKVLLKFKLLEVQRMSLADIEVMFREVPIIELANRELGLATHDLAERIGADLVRAGVARFEDDVLVDTG